MVFGDSPELITAAVTLGVAHPPGYPIFTMLGWLFAQIPIESPAFRVVLLSVVCHAATVGVIYAATYRFARSVSAAVVAAVALATQPLFWSWSLVAEVFALSDLIAAIVLFLVALWHERPERKAFLIGAAFATGLGLANHQTIALLAPAVLYVLWRRRDALLAEPRLIGYAALAFVLGLLPYAELLVAAARQPTLIWGELRSPGDLLAYMLRTRYGTTALVNEPAFVGGSALGRVAAVFTTLGLVHFVILALGTAYAWRRARWYATYLLIAFAVAGPAFAAYSNVDISNPVVFGVLQRFFLLAYTAAAPLAGFAALWILALARRTSVPSRLLEGASAAVVVLLLVALGALNFAALDRRDDHAARRYVMDVLTTVPQNGIFISGADGIAFPLLYLQTVEGVRTDVTNVLLPFMGETWYVRQLRRMHPDLALPQDAYGTRTMPFRVFIDANRSRSITMVGELPDDSAKSAYWLYPRGIVSEIRPLAQTASVEEFARDAEAALSRSHPPAVAEVSLPFRPWERLVLEDYAGAYYRVGSEYEHAADNLKVSAPEQARQGYATARTWYERALAVDPEYVLAKVAVQRLPRS